MDIESVFEAAAEKLRIDFGLLSKQIDHNLSKGRVREADLIEGFLRPHLPGNVGIAHGAEIVATRGPSSGECDIVIYDRNAAAIIDNSTYKVIPIEAVYIIIEVKSNLDSKQLKLSFDKIRKVKSMPKSAYNWSNSPKRQIRVFDHDYDYFPTLGFVFSYESMSIKRLRDELEYFHNPITPSEQIDGLWVLKSGAILHWSDDRREVLYAASSGSRLRAATSENPLLSMLIVLDLWCQSAWMPTIDLLKYVDPSRLLTFDPSDATPRTIGKSSVEYKEGLPVDGSRVMGQTSPNMDMYIGLPSEKQE